MADHKPTIETIVNTTAIALTTFGVANITAGGWTGYFAVAFGMALEFFKYYGRKKNFW